MREENQDFFLSAIFMRLRPPTDYESRELADDRILAYFERDSTQLRRLREKMGRENIPLCICSSVLGSKAHQWPFENRQCSTRGGALPTNGGNTLLNAGCIGTAS